jgi:hypothetical protein
MGPFVCIYIPLFLNLFNIVVLTVDFAYVIILILVNF